MQVPGGGPCALIALKKVIVANVAKRITGKEGFDQISSGFNVKKELT